MVTDYHSLFERFVYLMIYVHSLDPYVKLKRAAALLCQAILTKVGLGVKQPSLCFTGREDITCKTEDCERDLY